MAEDLILTDEEKQFLALEPILTKVQRRQIEAKRTSESLFAKHDGFPLTPANVEMTTDMMLQHNLDPTVEANWENTWSVLDQADLFEVAQTSSEPAPKRLTNEELDRMSAEELKRRVNTEPGFAEQVDALPQEAPRPRDPHHAG